MPKRIESRTKSFLFRDLPQKILIGTASDRYAGWIGQVGLVFSHWTWLPPLRKQFAKVGMEFFNAGNQAIIRLMTPLDMGYEESSAGAFPFDKIIPDMLDPEMIEDADEIINEAVKEKVQVKLIINNRAAATPP